MALPQLVESSVTILLYWTDIVKSAVPLCGWFFPPLVAGVREEKIMTENAINGKKNKPGRFISSKME